MRRQDLTAERYNSLVVIGKADEKQDRYTLWHCRCDCGNEILVNTRHLKRGTVKNCGCIPKQDAKRGPVAEDLSGQIFDQLTVLHRAPSLKGRTRWVCKCSCGGVKEISTRELKLGKARSCGCRHRKRGRYPTDLSGQTFGRLTVLYATDKRDKKSSVYWMCRCECGEEIEVTAAWLRQGVCRSCGCLKRENQRQIHKKLHRIDGTCVEWLEKRKYRSDNTSGFRGVYKMKNGKYRVSIGFKGQRFHVGIFEVFEDAMEAREQAEALMHDGFVQAYYRWIKNAEEDPDWAAAHPFTYDVEKNGKEFIVKTYE